MLGGRRLFGFGYIPTSFMYFDLNDYILILDRFFFDVCYESSTFSLNIC